MPAPSKRCGLRVLKAVRLRKIRRGTRLREPQLLAEFQTARFFEHRVPKGAVADREATMPEQVGLAVGFAARLGTGPDPAQLSVPSSLRALARCDIAEAPGAQPAAP